MNVLPDQLPFWIAGPLLGLLVVGLFVVANQPLGASGAYLQTMKAAKRDADTVSWRVWYFGGIFVGGAVATILGPGIEIRRGYDAMSNAGWSPIFIALVVLAGAIVMGYGARMAGGCTWARNLRNRAALPRVVGHHRDLHGDGRRRDRHPHPAHRRRPLMEIHRMNLVGGSSALDSDSSSPPRDSTSTTPSTRHSSSRARTCSV